MWWIVRIVKAETFRIVGGNVHVFCLSNVQMTMIIDERLCFGVITYWIMLGHFMSNAQGKSLIII